MLATRSNPMQAEEVGYLVAMGPLLLVEGLRPCLPLTVKALSRIVRLLQLTQSNLGLVSHTAGYLSYLRNGKAGGNRLLFCNIRAVIKRYGYGWSVLYGYGWSVLVRLLLECGTVLVAVLGLELAVPCLLFEMVVVSQ